MLNAEDALGLQEDLAIMQSNRRRARSAALMAEEATNATAAHRMLDLAEVTVQKARADLAAANSSRNDLNAVAKATREVLHMVMEEWAKATGEPVDQIRARVLNMVSRRYDKLVDEAIARGSILIDKRRDPELSKQRNWYIEP